MTVAVFPDTTPLPGLRRVADDPASAIADNKVQAAIRVALAAGVRLIDLATLAGVTPAAVLRLAEPR